MKYLCGLMLGLLGTAGLWLTAVWWQTGAATVTSQWSSDIIEVKKVAAGAEHSSKLLILGGSSTLFGINAAQIRSETGIPTINFGVHGTLGIRYMLYLAGKSLSAHDSILLTFEYSLFDGGMNDGLLDYIYSRDPQYLDDLPATDRWKTPFQLSIPRLLIGLKSMVRPHGRVPPVSECYSAASLNQYGDETCERQSGLRSPQAFLLQGLLYPTRAPSADEAFKDIRQFRAWAQQQGVRVLATYPSTMWKADYDDSSWRSFFAQLSNFYRSINVPTIGSPRDFMYDESRFFDTPHHLTSLGASERTRQLIALLRPYW